MNKKDEVFLSTIFAAARYIDANQHQVTGRMLLDEFLPAQEKGDSQMLKPLNIQPQDQAFYDKCKAWLDASARSAGGQRASAYPAFFNNDGSLNRKRMLELPCYADSGIAEAEKEAGR